MTHSKAIETEGRIRSIMGGFHPVTERAIAIQAEPHIRKIVQNARRNGVYTLKKGRSGGKGFLYNTKNKSEMRIPNS